MTTIDKKSVIRHNNGTGGYKQLTVEAVKEQNEACTKNLMQYDDDKPLGRQLDGWPDIDVCVDIGSGLGWAADLMAKTRKRVYAIEPSKEAMAIAKELYSDVGNIVWMTGFAEEELANCDLKEPTFFNTLCVLSHLEDETVLKICSVVDQAPRGSVLSFSELWGNEKHQDLWHTRTKEWWSFALPSFKLNFIERPCQGSFKSFTGFKE